VDSSFSLEPAELASLVLESERAWQSLGTVAYGPSEAERKSIQFRRSIYVVRDLEAGAVLDQDNLRCIRPGFGLPPKHYEALLGRRLLRAVRRGTPMAWDLVEDA
jgi:N-acetylneuraminate synthase